MVNMEVAYDTSLIILLLVTSTIVSSSSIVYPCVTPNHENAYCVSLFTCPHLLKSLSTSDSKVIDYVRNSICIHCCRTTDFMVCCGTPEKYPYLNLTTTNECVLQVSDAPVSEVPATTPEPLETTKTAEVSMSDKEAHREYARRTLLFSTKFCGLQQNDDRFVTSNGTELDEFPWLAHLKLSNLEYDNEFGDRCTGVLINNRYVLTDAYCGYEAVRVILGQYNTNTTFTCLDEEQADCSEPKVEYKVESKARSGKQENGPYDLTLLRLNRRVTLSDYVRPICLPVDGSKRPPEQDYLTFSGWGAAGPEGIVKKRLEYNLTESQLCYDHDPGLDGNVKFAGVSHVCLKPSPENKNKACNGEHGGPLMYKHKQNWFADGIIIEVFRNNSAGREGYCSDSYPVSGIYITSDMMNWILDSISD